MVQRRIPMFNMVKLGIGAGLLIAIGWFSYNAGQDSIRAEIARTEQKAKVADAGKVEQVIKYKEKIKVVYRDKVIKIKQAKDITGCADVKLTDMGFRL